MLELPLFMGMHPGMDEEHVFAVDVHSNDPVEPVKTVRWRFVPEDVGWKTWMKGVLVPANLREDR